MVLNHVISESPFDPPEDRWPYELIGQLRKEIENGASSVRISELADLYGQRTARALFCNQTKGADVIDELDSMIQAIDERPEYHSAGIRTRVEYSLLLGSHDLTRAAEVLSHPLSALLLAIDNTPSPEKDRLYPEVALLRLAYARVAEKKGEKVRFLAMLKLACDHARKSPNCAIATLVFRRFRSALIEAGRPEIAAVITATLEALPNLPDDWITNELLWNL